MARQTRYSAERVAEVLAIAEAYDNNPYQVERATGVPRETVRDWLNGRNTDIKGGGLHLLKNEELADRIQIAAQNALYDQDVKRESASYADHWRAVGIAVDKMQLLRGKPTAINARLTTEDKKRILIEAGILTEGATIDAEIVPIDDTHAHAREGSEN